MNSITTYIPKRDILGRFIPSKKKAFKALFVLLALTSFYANYLLASKVWNFRCQVNGQVMGYFTTKQACGDMAEAKMDSLELARQKFIREGYDY